MFSGDLLLATVVQDGDVVSVEYVRAFESEAEAKAFRELTEKSFVLEAKATGDKYGFVSCVNGEEVDNGEIN